MIDRHPYRALLTVLGAFGVFAVLSDSGYPGGSLSSWPSWLGELAWIGLWVSIVAFIGLLAYLAVRRLTSGRQVHRA